MKRFTAVPTALLISAISSLASANPSNLPRYTFTDLGTLGGPEAAALDINDVGDIVGWSDVDNDKACFTAGGPINCHHAFMIRDGEMHSLGQGRDDAQHTQASKINNQGHIIGYSRVVYQQGWQYLPWRLSETGATPLPLLSDEAGSNAMATDINELGDIVGWADADSGQDTAVIWRDGDVWPIAEHESFYRRASATNNLGDIAGFEYERWSGKPNRGFVQTLFGFSMLEADETLWSEAQEINDFGVIAGSSTDRPFSPQQATLWLPGLDGQLDKHIIGTLSQQLGSSSEFLDINLAGMAVGFSADSNAASAILYLDGQLLDLNRLTNVDGQLTQATGINLQGQIVGSYLDRQGRQRAYLLTPMAD